VDPDVAYRRIMGGSRASSSASSREGGPDQLSSATTADADRAYEKITGKKPGQVTTSTETPISHNYSKDLFQGMWEGGSPVQSWEDAQSLWNTVNDPYQSVIRNIVTGIVDSHIDQFKEMMAHDATSRTLPTKGAQMRERAKALQNFVGGIIPAIGPQIERAAELVETGDPQQVVRGVGRLLTQIGPFFLGKAMGKISDTPKPKSLLHGRVPITRYEQTGGTLAGWTGEISERSFLGTHWPILRETQQQALFDQSALRVADMISQNTGSISDRILASRQSLKAEQARLTSVNEAAYDSIDKRTGTVRPSTQGVKLSARRIKQEYAKAGKLADVPPELTRLLDKILAAPAQMSYKGMQIDRSLLLAITRRSDLALPGRVIGAVKQFAKDVDAAMEEAANTVGVKDPVTGRTPLQKDVRSANAFSKQLHEDFNESVIDRIYKMNPLKATALLRETSLEDLRTLKLHLPAQEFADLSGALYTEMIQDAIDWVPTTNVHGLPPARQLSPAARQRFTPTTTEGLRPVLNGKKLFHQYVELGERKAVLFTPAQDQAITELAGEGLRVGKSPRGIPGLAAGMISADVFTSVVSLTAAWMMHGTAASPYLMDAAVVTGGTAGAVFLAGQLLSRPEGLLAIRRYAKALGTGSRPAMATASLQVMRAADEAAKSWNQRHPKQAIPTPSTQAGTPPTTQPSAGRAAGAPTPTPPGK
jgi:hypothetical protein